MDRESVLKEILQISESNMLLQLPTSFGKSKCAIELIKKHECSNVLIVIPRLVLIDNWKEELKKWDCNINPTFTTYVSLQKHIGNYDAIIYDECHHLSDRCISSLPYLKAKKNILLSATVKRQLLGILKVLFLPLKVYTIQTKDAIANEVLPDPEVHLIPLHLNNYSSNCTIVLNPKEKTTVKYKFFERWQAMKIKNKRVEISCTQKEWIEFYDSRIEYFKRNQHQSWARNAMLFASKQRLDFLSNIKTPYVKTLLKRFDKERTLTFCSTIEQSNELGANSLNSKNKDSEELLEKFNNGEINHITAVNMLNEGMNLRNCKVGIYANLNSSEIIVAQRLGRLLRHKNPIIIIPYFVGTREEELKDKMLESYNKDKIHIGL